MNKFNKINSCFSIMSVHFKVSILFYDYNKKKNTILFVSNIFQNNSTVLIAIRLKTTLLHVIYVYK